MSETAARGGLDQVRAGGLIIVAISALSAFLVIAGLAYAAGTGGRHEAALATASCEPNLSPSGLQCTTVQQLTGQYTQITGPATQQLNTDAAAYAASDFSSRVAAQSALLAEVTVEKALGRSLAAFPFPAADVPAAKALMKANLALAGLTAEQSQSPSLFRMRSFNNQVFVARAAVQTNVGLVLKALQTPPTATQEP